jgi:hypothetical protein
MKKKMYMKPELEVVVFDMPRLLSGSAAVNVDGTGVIDGGDKDDPSGALAREYDFFED